LDLVVKAPKAKNKRTVSKGRIKKTTQAVEDEIGQVLQVRKFDHFQDY